MNDSRLLLEAIERDPRETTPKLMLADYYQERGEVLLELAVRWCVSHGRWPQTLRGVTFWHCQATAAGRGTLPRSVFDALSPRQGASWFWVNRYRSIEAALRAVGRALVKLRRVCEV